jgi:hypothetical protein
VLFSLPPIGIGTPGIECLTSYIGRLAWAHSISTSKLITKLIVPKTGKKYFGTANPDVLDRGCSAAVNASGATATTFVSVIEHLTGQSDLQFLTLSHWFRWARMNSPVSLYKVWCPFCYEDARTAGRVVVDQLIWTLKDITVCSVHTNRLLDKCPKCNARSPWLLRYSLPGYCIRCRVWLGKSQSFKSKSKENRDEYALWCAESVAALFAAKGFELATEEQLLGKVAAVLSHGPLTAYASLLGVCRSSIVLWSKRKSLPRLKGILKISRLSKNTLTEYMDARVPVSNLKFTEVRQTRKKQNRQSHYDGLKVRTLAAKALHEDPPPTLSDVARRLRNPVPLSYRTNALKRLVPDLSRKIVDRRVRYTRKLDEMRRRSLRAFASRKHKPPISINEVAQLLQVPRLRLHKLCPKSCKTIRARLKVHKKRMRQARETAIEREIRDSAHSLHKQGIYPSFPKVSAMLSTSSWLIRESRRQVLRQIQIQLGYRSS